MKKRLLALALAFALLPAAALAEVDGDIPPEEDFEIIDIEAELEALYEEEGIDAEIEAVVEGSEDAAESDMENGNAVETPTFTESSADLFDANGRMTRANAAVFLCRLLGLGEAGSSIFPDAVGHAAEGYIASATQAGIVHGNGAGYFQPDDDVTYEQMIKMMVCAAGYGSQASAAGGWAGGYLSVGAELGITAGLTFTATAPATQQDIAVLASNFMS